MAKSNPKSSKKVTKVEPVVEIPAEPIFIPEITNTQEVVKVYIEDKSVTAYKRPIVHKPDSKLSELKTFNTTEAVTQPGTKLPDLFPELDEATRKYLKLGKFGDNIIINKRYISRLLQFYFESRNLKLPSHTQQAFREHMNLIRETINLCTVEESEAKAKEDFPGSYEPSYPSYRCTCSETKKKK